MEISGEKILKKGTRTSKWIIIGYIICIIAIIGAAYSMVYREENLMPEPIDFTTNVAIGLETDKYAYLKIEGLTDEVAIFGDVENESDSTNDRYYIAMNGSYLYIVDLNFETIDMLKEIQDYTYSTDENAVPPEAVTVYGMTEAVPEELKTYMVDFFNQSIGGENQITIDDFEDYFGSVLLNVRRSPIDTTVEEAIIICSAFIALIIFVYHLVSLASKLKMKKYITKNGYKEDLIEQLENSVEEKHYKDKVIITKDFLVDFNNDKFSVVKFSDVKWIYIHNVKYYGVLTVSSSIMACLDDGKTKFQCVNINGKPTDEFVGIFNKICEKVPADCLKGFTAENKREYKG